jgi:hypothetical protein
MPLLTLLIAVFCEFADVPCLRVRELNMDLLCVDIPKLCAGSLVDNIEFWFAFEITATIILHA